MGQDYASWFFGVITQLTTQHSGQFEAMGLHLFLAFAATLICWFGIQTALASAGGSGGFQWARFVTLLQELLFCYAMVAFYSQPIPGIGISFTHLVLDQVQTMISQLDQSTVQSVIEMLNALDSNLPFPSLWEPCVCQLDLAPFDALIWPHLVFA